MDRTVGQRGLGAVERVFDERVVEPAHNQWSQRTTNGQATRIMPVVVASMMWRTLVPEPTGTISNRCTPSRPVGGSNWKSTD